MPRGKRSVPGAAASRPPTDHWKFPEASPKTTVGTLRRNTIGTLNQCSEPAFRDQLSLCVCACRGHRRQHRLRRGEDWGSIGVGGSSVSSAGCAAEAAVASGAAEVTERSEEIRGHPENTLEIMDKKT